MKKKSLHGVVWYKSLAFTLMLMFVLLAVIPVLLISYDSYKESIKSIEQTSYHDIEQAATLEKKFINNWFHYRETDIRSWSQSDSVVDFLSYLEYDFQNEKSSLHEYIKSDSYADATIMMEKDILQLVKNYDYLYDVFLIDKSANILYTFAKEADLGTNLIDGAYASTKFAKAVRKTIVDKNIHFSDLELYAPSNNIVAGFLVAPVFDEGDFIGVFAIQIKLDTIYHLFEDEKISNRAFSHYLVGEDGILRSKLDDASEILKKKIDTQQFQLWNLEHGKHGEHATDEDEPIFVYKDANGKDVFGLHQDIDILGVKWALISESSLNVIDQLRESVIEKTIKYVLALIFIIVIFGYIISQRLVRPIIELSQLTTEFTNGNRDVEVNVNISNEVGVLAQRFKDMMHSIKQGEEELDEQKYALDAHSIVSVTTIEGEITYVNSKFVDICGYSKEELLGANHRLLSSKRHSKDFWRSMYNTISNGKVWHGDIQNCSKSGKYYWVSTTIVPFMDEAGHPRSYIAIRTDITQKKNDEAELIEAKAIAEESVRAKSEFFASMSHEIRTPMNGVIGMLGLLLNTKLNDSQRHQAYLAQNSAKALLNLINDILDFSKFESGKLELEEIDFNLRDDFGDFAEAIAFRAQEKGVAVILDVKDVDFNYIRGDSGRIRQILNNLVSNAIKFTESGYVLVKVLLNKEDNLHARLLIDVQDTGIGIPEDKIDTLFDSFSQVDASTTRKYGGTGLGLAIVKKLCEIMDGSVRVKSKLGNGTLFQVDIAVKLAEDRSIAMPEINVKNKKALIVDKCIISADVLSEQLKHWGMITTFDSDTKDEIDIVYIDKDSEALEMAKELKKKHQNAKFILMTSLKDTANVTEFMESVFDTHYPKPATTQDILKSLRVLSPEYTANTIIVSEEDSTQKLVRWSKDVRILLVDDNKVNQLVANGILEEIGLEADIASNGVEAVDAVKNMGDTSYSIILMDCQMPQMDGYEATKIIKSGDLGERSSQIPIVAMTANAMEGDREKCFASGMDDYLSKPINPEELEAMLRKYIA